jgi:hypothetical protein
MWPNTSISSWLSFVVNNPSNIYWYIYNGCLAAELMNIMFSMNSGLGADSLLLHMPYCTPWIWNQGWIPFCYKNVRFCTPRTWDLVRIPCCCPCVLYSMNLGPAEDSLLLHMPNVLREPATRFRFLGAAHALLYSKILRSGSDSLLLHKHTVLYDPGASGGFLAATPA